MTSQTPLESRLARVARDLDAEGAAWALVGGLAVSIRAEPRFTRDIDVVVSAASDRDVERLGHGLLSRGYRPVWALEHTVARRLAGLRLVLPGGDADEVVVDLLFASSGIEAEVVRGAGRLEVVPGVVAPVASIGHLIALKVLARDDDLRPQDLVDLRGLCRRAAPEDVDAARVAVGLISERGFDRGKDLAGALSQVLGAAR